MKKSILVLAGLVLAGTLSILSCRKHKTEKSAFDKLYERVNDPQNHYFWEQFHNGRIENVKAVIQQLEQQYLEDSTNLIATAHLGFARFWLLSEGLRGGITPEEIPAHVAAARRFFAKAYEMNPNDKRVLGFLADAEMAHAGMIQSQELQQQGYARGLESINAWPEFNKFTIGISFAGAPIQSPLFQQALDWQWTTLEDCYTSTVDRSNPAIQEFINRDLSGHNLGRKRACYNSWIAPHNIEGYFLNMGDMIVRTGDAATAKKIYALAKASPNYNSWAFKEVLEKRIQHAERNTTVFLDPAQQGIDNVIIASSGYNCSSCHKMSAADQEHFKNYNWVNYFKTRDIYSVNGLKN
ncbi:MAG: hypothetical protein J7599_00560 [Niabella sp.]|nr:hypothetical protein [Niabella sp.]